MADWIATTAENWSVSTNWNGGTLPNSTTDAVFNTGTVITVDSSAAAQNVLLNGSQTIDINGGAGQLSVTSNVNVAASGKVVVRNGSLLTAATFTGAGQLIIGGETTAEAAGTVNLNSISFSAGGQIRFNATDDLNFNKSIQGAGSLVKDGANTVSLGGSLSGANSYSGTTTVNAGTLQLQFGDAIGDSSAVTVNAAGRLEVTSAETIGSLAGSGIVQLQGGGNTLTTGGDNSTTIFSGIIEGGGSGSALVKAGTGTFTLSGVNTYSGLTTVSAGVLKVSNATSLGTTSQGTTVLNGAALEVAVGTAVDAESLTLNGTGIGNSGALRKEAVGGNATYNGLITLGSDSRINSDGGSSLFLGGGITGIDRNLTLGGDSGISLSGNITTGSGTLTKDGTGTAGLGGTNIYTGTTTINAGALQLGGGAAIADTGVVVVNAPGTLRLSASETIGSLAGSGGLELFLGSTLTTGGDNSSTTFSGAISEAFGGGSLTKVGTGTFTLSGASSYTGATNVNAGVLRISNATALGSTAGGTTVAAGAALELAGVGQSAAEALTLNGTGINGGGALRNVSGFNVYAGLITLASATRINADTDNLFLVNITGANQNLTLGGAGIIYVDGGITTGSGSLTKDGVGTVVLRAENSYSGVTAVNSGSLEVLVAGSLASTVVNVSGRLLTDADALAAGATVTVSGIGLFTSSGTDSFAALNQSGGQIDGSGIQTLSGAFTQSGGALSGTVDINAAIFTQSGGAVISAGTTVTSSGTQSLQGGTVAGALDGTGAITVSGTTGITGIVSNAASLTVSGGVLSLSGANTYTGVTTVNSGTLQLSGGAAIADSGVVVVNAPGLLRLSTAETIGSLAGSGGLELLAGSALTMGGNDSSTTFSGAISQATGVGTLTKVGTGTFTLSGINTYTGATTVASGTLALSGNGSIANSSSLVLGSGVTFDISAVTTAVTVQNLVTSGPANFVSAGDSLTINNQTGSLSAATFTGGTGADMVTINLASSVINYSLSGVQYASWTAETDTLTLNGNALGNSLTGTSRNDRINGLSGDDVLFGGAGNDELLGDIGTDYLFSGNGSNTLSGGAGLDILVSEGLGDILNGGADQNYYYRQAAGTSQSFGGDGVDILVGGDANASDDLFYGFGGDDFALGGAGNDELIGGNGNDILLGQDGSDILDGGLGTNYLYADGAGGSDTVRVSASLGGAQTQLLVSFEGGGTNDVLEISGSTLTSYAQFQTLAGNLGVVNNGNLLQNTGVGALLTLGLGTANQTDIWFLGTLAGGLTSADFTFVL